jgi:hypothetical protein
MPKFPKAKTQPKADPESVSPYPQPPVDMQTPESAPPIVKAKVMGKSQFGPVQTDNKQKP